MTPPPPDPGPGSGSEPTPDLPFDGTVLVKAGALASVPLARLPEVLEVVQERLSPRLDRYRREYERVVADTNREVFLVESDHWEAIGEELGFDDRTLKAIQRTHETQLERYGSRQNRREEFDTALEIRSAVVIGVG